MKKFTVTLSLLIMSVVYIYAEGLSLKKIRDRGYNPVSLSKNFRQKIAEDTKGLGERDIVLYCNKKTQEKLIFSTKCEKFGNL